MKIKKRNITVLLSFVMALCYASWLSRLPHSFFKDRANYLTYISLVDELIYIRFESANILFTLANEPLFLLLTKAITSIFNSFSDEQVLHGYVFLVCFSVCLYILKTRDRLAMGLLALIVFLMVPLSYGLQLGSIRQSLGMAFFLMGLIFNWKVHSNKFLSLVFILGFIHSFYFLVFTLLTLDKVIIKVYGNRIYIRLMFTTILSLVISFFGLVMASIIGMRQGETYSDITTDTSGMSFVLWGIVLFLLTKNSVRYSPPSIYHENAMTLATLGITFYLSLYWFSPIAGRTISFFFLFAVVSIFYRINYISILLFCTMLTFGALMFFLIPQSLSMTVKYSEMFKYLFSFS